MNTESPTINILHENCDLEKDNIKSLPYTAYVTEYEVEGKTQFDIAMGDKTSDTVSYTHLTLPTILLL